MKMVAVPNKEGNLFLCTRNGSALYKTIDGGTTWTTVSSITTCSTFGFGKAISPSTDPTLFLSGVIGGAQGIYYSTNLGPSWTQITGDKFPSGTIDLSGDLKEEYTFYAATSGRGIIYGTANGINVAVTGVSISPTNAALVVGNTQQLTATVSPTNATNKNLSWSSSNTSVATVNSTGLVTAVTAGSATITVTTQDGNKTATSVITVTLSTVATLSSLSLSVGTLSPTFAATTTAYTASVPNATNSITITPTVTDVTATVKVNGVAVTSGVASDPIPLVVGLNTITTVVTAQDGTTTTTYTISIDNTPYGSWKSSAFTDPVSFNDPAISGPLATPAHDGITNLVKYAMALDLMIPSTGKLPTVAPQDSHLTLTYRRNKTASDVTYTVQASDSLTGANWIPATTVISQTDPTPGGGTYWLVTVQDPEFITDNRIRFMRLRVNQ